MGETTTISNKVYPIKEKHSIREVVISLFLLNPILKPERFKELISSGYKDVFQQFGPISQFQVQLQKGDSVDKAQLKHEQNAGFKFTSFREGKIDRVLQGINEPQRTFISFHNLDYEHWIPFFNDYKKNITILSKVQSDMFVKAYSLHYIDELLWIDENSPLDKTLILKRNLEKIPGDFFTSQKPTFSLISEKEIGQSTYFDRVEIKVNSSQQTSLVISHNVTENLDDAIQLNELFQSGFEQKIEDMHSYNKEMLGNLLQENVQTLIGLKPKTLQ